MNRKGKSGGEGGSPAWMATFADMSTLLLTFFILLLSFAEMDIVKFKDALGSIQEALGIAPSGSGMFKHTTSPTEFEKPMAISSFKATNNAIISELDNLVSRKNLKDEVEIQSTKRGVVLRVKGRMFFTPGTAELRSGSRDILAKIAAIMKKFPRKIAIEGHTDNIPLNGGRYANNWELSTARAYAALRYLQEYEDIDVERIHIAGFADTRPIASNSTVEGRSKNRRVEFVFYEE